MTKVTIYNSAGLLIQTTLDGAAEVMLLRQKIDEQEKLIELARCPNTACDNSGNVAVLIGNSWEQEHCQWCHEAGHCCKKEEPNGD
jgi:hypothetical protein